MAIRASRIEHEIGALIRDLSREMLGSATLQSPPLELGLSLSFDAAGSPVPVAEGPLREQLARALQQLAARTDSLRPGRTYCYWCETAGCDHATPPRPEAVFGGYAPT